MLDLQEGAPRRVFLQFPRERRERRERWSPRDIMQNVAALVLWTLAGKDAKQGADEVLCVRLGARRSVQTTDFVDLSTCPHRGCTTPEGARTVPPQPTPEGFVTV